MNDKSLDQLLGERLKSLREERSLSLAELAEISGVSKAMIARVEKAQSSATAALLGRLCAGLGVRLSAVIAATDERRERISRRGEQPTWRDPETGYVRRQISPRDAESGIDIASIELPPGTKVPYEAWAANAYSQQLLMLDGTLDLLIGDERHKLRAGDCVDFDVARPNVFENRGRKPARYLVIIRKN